MEHEVLVRECQARRQRLLEQLPEGSIGVLFAREEVFRNHDANYPFRQTSDFYYLTGIAEQDAVLVFVKTKDQQQSILFSHKKDPSVEQWVGPRVGTEQAKSVYQFDDAYELDQLDEKLIELMGDTHALYASFDELPQEHDRVFRWLRAVQRNIRKGINAPSAIQDLSLVIHEMRLIKSDYEIDCLRQAGKISAEAHAKAMERAQPGQYEYQIEGVLVDHFMAHGARHPAYESIVAGGANACVLHYTNNRDQLKDGDLLLIDAGCELHHYAADITRTFPINGTFTQAQRDIYQLVLDSQVAAIELVKPGLQWAKIQECIVKILVEGLVKLGILSGDVDKLIEEKQYTPFYMHNSGHWLGLDVHDRGRYKLDGESRPLEAGMVFTIEPGLYLSKGDTSIPEQYRGIGVRIEDDILVTADGYENLTAGVPKIIEEVETLCHATA